MTCLFFLSFLLLVPGQRTDSDPDPFSENALLPWKGFCALLILMSHFTGYISASAQDEIYLFLRDGMGQGIVTLFFWSSGYGLPRRFQASGHSYLARIPRKMLRVWLICACSTLLMLCIQYMRGREYDLYVVMLAFIPFANLGNSPWFILAVMICYLIFLVSSGICSRLFHARGPLPGVLLSLLLIAAVILLGMHMELDLYWYDTIILFPVGSAMALISPGTMRKILRRPDLLAFLFSAVLTGITSSYCFQTSFFSHEVFLVCSCLLILLLAACFTPSSRFLSFLGRRAVFLYLFARVPMVIFYETGYMDMAPHLTFFPVLACSCLLSILIEKCFSPRGKAGPSR